MSGSIIKFFTIAIFSFCIYVKIVNDKEITIPKAISSILYSCILAFIMYYSNSYSSLFRIFILIFFIYLYLYFITKKEHGLLILTATIALAMSYGINIIATTVTAIIIGFIFPTINMMLLSVLTLPIQGLLVHLLFLNKRLRKGFLFLQSKEFGSTGLVISSFILILISLLTQEEISKSIKGTFYTGAIICFSTIIFWWRSNLTKKYREDLRERELKEALDTISEKERENKKLLERNNFLASLIHRDNKLIPAMGTAVREFIILYNNNPVIEKKGASILNQLDEVMQERMDTIMKDQREHKVLPSTKVDLIDSTLQYFYLKAIENNIIFDLVITANIKYMIEQIIPVGKLQTLLADHIENSIIALRTSTYKRILVTFGINDNCYEISIQDSGIPFETETLIYLGRRKITTHSAEGGSGIGFMTTFEILKETGASLIIEEYPEKPFAFSKAIIIHFDGLNRYDVQSYRAGEIKERIAVLDSINKISQI